MADAQTLGEVEVLLKLNFGSYTQDVARAENAARGLSNTASKEMKSLESSMDKAAAKAAIFAETMIKLRNIGATLGLALAVRQVVDYADTWSDLSSRLKIATGSADAAAAVMNRLESIARRSYQPLAQTAETFLNMDDNLKSLGYSTQKELDFTEALNNALVVSGAKGERAASVMFAISKAMGQGVLSGDQLRTVMQTGGEVANILAEALHTTIPGLRAMGAQGKITGDIIATALLKNLERLKKEADDMPATLQDAAIQMGNAFLGLIGRVDQATGVSGGLAMKIKELSDVIANFATPAINAIKDAVAAAQVWIKSMGENGQLAGKILKDIFTSGVIISGIGLLVNAIQGPLTFAFKVLRIEMLANPLFLIPTLLVAAALALYRFRDDIKKSFGVDVVEVFKGIANFIIKSFQIIGVVVASIVEDLRDKFYNLRDWIQEALGGVATWIKENLVEPIRFLIDSIKELRGQSVDAANTTLTHNPYPVGSNAHTMFEQQSGNTDKNRAKAEASPDAASFPGSYFKDNQTSDMSTVTGRLEKSIADIMAKDPLGAITDKMKDWGTAAKEAAVDLTKHNDAVTVMDPKLRKILDDAQKNIDSLKLEARLIGVSAEAANAARIEFELLAKAKEAALKLSPADREAIHDLAASQAKLQEQVNKSQEAFAMTRDVVMGFINDMRSGLEQGKSLWESFGNAVTNVLNKIVDKLLNEVMDALLQVDKVGAGGGGGGLLGMIVKAVGGLTGATIGGGAPAAVPYAQATGFNLATATSFHTGGIVGQGGPQRTVSASLFNNAPRFHRGGEVPAILEEGETVIPRGGMRGTNGGGGGGAPPQIQFNVHNNGAPVKASQRGQPSFDGRAFVVDIVLDTLQSGKADPAMRRYGGKPVTAGRG